MNSDKKNRRHYLSSPRGRNVRRRSARPTLERLEDRTVPDTAFHNLATGPLAQNWSDPNLLSGDDNWSSVPSITGYLGEGVGYNIANATQTGTRVTISTVNPGNFNQDSPNHRFIVGQKVTVAGVNVPGYNGTFTIVNKVNDTSFQYETTAGLPSGSGGTAWSTSFRHGASTATSGDYTRDLNANQTDPNTFAPRGVTEFELPNPTVALAGDATAAAPYLMFYLTSTNLNNIRVQYTIRDLDSSANNSVQSVALQYREASISNGIPTFGTYSGVGGQWRPGTWTNIPAAYVADATDPNSATRTTTVDVILPNIADNRQFFALRIITANATGVDEYVGIDDIRIGAAGRLNFSPSYNASEGGGVALITVNRTNGSSGSLLTTFTTPYGISTATSVGTTATITTTASHLFVVGQPVTVAGVSVAGYNGNFTITSVTANTFTYTTSGSGLAGGTGGTVTSGSGAASGTATLGSDYTATSGVITFGDGQTSQVFTVPVLDNGDNSYGISSATSAGTTATITTATNHLFIVGQPVAVAGVAESGYNGTFTVTAVTANTFSYTTAGSGLPASSGGTASGAEPASETVPLSLVALNVPIATVTTDLLTLTSTVTTPTPHGFSVGQQIVTAGVTTFTASLSSAASAGTTATITTTANHLFAVGQPVVVAGVSVAGYNGTFTITAVTANTFSYTTPGSNLGAGTGGTTTSVANIDMYNDTTGGFLITSVPTPTTFTFQAQNFRNNAAGIAGPGVGGTVRLASASLIGTSTTTLNINDNDGAGTVQFSAASYTVGEGKGTAILTVTRTGSTVGGLVVTFTTSNDTAFAGLDYTATTGTVAFNPGETIKTFTVNISNDAGALEGPEAFTVTLSNLFGGPMASIGAQSSASVTITEPGQIAISPTSVTFSEGTGQATVTVTRINASPGSGGATVQYSTSNGSATAGADYSATTGTLTWDDGDFSPKTFTVDITDDTDFAESLTETINLTLTNSWNISSASSVGTTATITTSAPHGFVAGQQVVIRGTSIPGYNGTFTVASVPTATTFTYTTVAGLSNFSSVSGATAAYDDAVITGSSGTVTITDNDGQGTLAFSSATYAIGEGRGPVTLTVIRTGSANGPLTVLFATADGSATAGSDYNTATGTLTWANGDSAPKTFTVNISNDATNVEGSEDFTVTLSDLNGVFGAPMATIGTPNPATVTITEPGQIQFSASSYTVVEGTPQVTVTVTRVNGSAGPVTVQYATSNGSATSGAGNDYLTATGSLSWAAGDTAPKTFTVDILDDTTAETTETINLALTNGVVVSTASQAGTTVTVTTATNHGFVGGQQAVVSGVSVGGYNGTFFITAVTANTFTYETTAGLAAGTGGLANTTVGATFGSPSSATVNITDNDGAGVIELSAATYTIAENGTGPLTITVNRTGSTAGTVSVVFNVTGGTATLGQDYSGTYTGSGGSPGNNQLNRTLTFGPGATSQTFQIRPVDDNTVEGDETVNIVLSNVLGGGTLGTISGAVLTITDAESGRAEFTSSSYTATEQGGSLTVTVSRVGASTATLTVPYSTINGTAIAGEDFTAVSGILTWLPGDTAPKTFVVPMIDDYIPESAETFQVSLGQTGLGAGAGAAAVPTIWYNFDAAGDNPLDGYIFDQGPNALDLRTFQRNGRTPVSGFVLAPELLNTAGGTTTYRSLSGATFPGAGEAYFLEGGRSRTHEPFGPLGIVTSVNDDRFSGLQLAPGPRGSTITGSTFADNRLNSGNNNSGHSSVTYSFWLQLPELVGTDFFPNRYGQGGNRTTLIGRSSDPGSPQGEGGSGGDFGGQVAVRTILNYQQDPGFNPGDLTGTVKYTFELRANQQFGAFGSGGFVATNTTFKVAEWNHFAISYTPTSTLIYKNGVLSETLPIGTMDLGKNAIEEIEGWLRLNQVGFNGASIQEQGTFKVDDLGVWTQQLTAADIQRLYTQGIGVAVANTATVTIPGTTEENGAVSFSAATYALTEGDAGSMTATITVNRIGTFGAIGAVSIDFATVLGGTATAGVDYIATSGTLSWANGETGPKTFTVTINGDLMAEANETINLALSNATGGVAVIAPSTAVLTITDNDGFIVSQFQSTRTGFTADFSRAFDSSVLNLYDVQGDILGPADATLVGPTGQVRGSLVVNPTANSVTFIVTSGTLAAGSYTVRLRTAANGFKDTMGGLLDGNIDGTPGDDFVRTFTVAAPAAVAVSVPNFARGPGQPVNIPAAATGLPLRLSNGTGVTRVDLTLRWNESLLSITDATVGPNMPAGSSVVINSSSPGMLSLTFTSPDALAAGVNDFVILTASVPMSTASAYTSKHVLDISDVTINEGGITGEDDDGLHIVAYVGDVTGNGTYSASDATRILRVAVGLDGGFLAYQLADPVVAGDVNGSGTVTAIDATRVLQEAVAIDTTEIPPLPSGSPVIIPAGPDPLLRFGRVPRARPGQTVTVPLLLDRPAGLESADLAISFDASRLELVRVERGNLTRDFDTFAVNADSTEGTIRVSMGRTTGSLGTSRPGSVLLVTFRIKDNAQAGGTVINLREGLGSQRTQLNEGGLDLNPDPSDEAGDALDGRIVIRGRARAVDEVFRRFRRPVGAGLSAEILAALTRKPRGAGPA